ncbi:MAG: hypothetical protein GWO02_20020, partial [Gammaproteobacteria bacterium]|nr:hypothetical protein [Gammaproteobacteria bacterium]
VERIRRAAGLAEGDDTRAQIDKLDAMLRRDSGDPEVALPVYERLLSIE